MRWGTVVTLAFGFAWLTAPTPAGAVAIDFSAPVDVPARVGPSAPYGSTASVGGSLGTILDVNVRVEDLTHPRPEDLNVLLVSPAGTKVELMRGAGGRGALTAFDLVLDDAAADALPDDAQIVASSYRPALFGSAPVFPSPAPPGPYATQLGAFNGEDPAGAWTLYVVDRASGSHGSYVNWSVEVTTVLGPVTATASQAVTVPASTGPGDPYPAVVQLSNLPGAIVSATATLRGVEHPDPGELDVLVQAPSGQAVMLMSDAGSGVPIAPPGVTLAFDDAAAGGLPAASELLAGSYKPTDYDPETLPSPAPGTSSTSLGSFVGGPVAGDWRVFAADDVAGGYGRLAGGFKLDVVSSGATAFGASSYVSAEGGDPAAITLTRAFAEGPSTVMVDRAGGSALAGDVAGLPATIQFAPGEATRIVAIRPTNDRVSETTERIDLVVRSTLGPAALGAQTTTSLEIFDNDPLPANPAPLLTRVSLTPRSFRAATSGGSIAAVLVLGTRVAYRLSEAASTFLGVEQARQGRRSGTRCLAETRRNAGARTCVRYATLRGTAAYRGRAGANAFRFRGRIGGRRLAPGNYRLLLRARDATGKLSGIVRVGFRIVVR